jgi:hypothetical protein
VEVAVLAGEHLRGDAVLVWAVSECAVVEEGGDDVSVAVGGGKVEWGGAGCADDGSGSVAISVVGVAAGESGDGEVGSGREKEGTDLGALTSAPLWMRRLTTRSLPPEEAAWRGSTPSRTELMGCPWESA